jgi:hypothetical protein
VPFRPTTPRRSRRCKKQQAVLLSNGTKVQFVRTWVNTGEGIITPYSQVRVLSGLSKDKVAWVGHHECFAFEAFPFKAGDEGVLSKGRLMSYATGIAVVRDVPAYNALLRSWRDGEPDNKNTRPVRSRDVAGLSPSARWPMSCSSFPP